MFLREWKKQSIASSSLSVTSPTPPIFRLPTAGGLFYLPHTTRLPDGYGTITHLLPSTSSSTSAAFSSYVVHCPACHAGILKFALRKVRNLRILTFLTFLMSFFCMTNLTKLTKFRFRFANFANFANAFFTSSIAPDDIRILLIFHFCCTLATANMLSIVSD